MKEPHYDEAYYKFSTKSAIINIDDLIELYVKNKTKFINVIDGNIYCPECHGPQLSFVKRSNGTFYLRKYPSQSHLNYCSKKLEPVSHSVFKEYCQDGDFCDDINCRLTQLIDKLLKKKKIHIEPEAVKVVNRKIQKQDVLKEEVAFSSKIKSIPTKSLLAPFNEEDFGVWKFFYGKVNIKWGTSKNSLNKHLKIYNQKSNKLVCLINISENVYSHLNDDIKHDLTNVFIAFAGVMTINKTSTRDYYNTVLRRSNFLVINY